MIGKQFDGLDLVEIGQDEIDCFLETARLFVKKFGDAAPTIQMVKRAERWAQRNFASRRMRNLRMLWCKDESALVEWLLTWEDVDTVIRAVRAGEFYTDYVRLWVRWPDGELVRYGDAEPLRVCPAMQAA